MKNKFILTVLLSALSLTGCASASSSSVNSSLAESSESVSSQEESSAEESHFTLDIDEEAIMSSASNANDSSFDDDKQTMHESVLKDKNIYWLGSSVTQGSQSQGITMTEYLDATCGTVSTKEALSGTTILTVEGDKKSYVQRLINSTQFKKGKDIDAFICQISTNDAKSANVVSWGEIT